MPENKESGRRDERQTGLFGLAERLMRLPTGKAVLLMLVGTVCAVVWSERVKMLDGVAEWAKTVSERRQHETALSDELQRQNAVTPILKAILKERTASRVSVKQFHNGTSSLRGIPFLFASTTYEVVAPGVSSEQLRQQRVPVQTIIDWIPRFLAGECVVQKVEDAKPPLSDALQDYGIHTALACPIFLEGFREPAAFVTMDFTRGWDAGDAATIEQSERRLKDAAFIIGANIQAPKY
ncbi:hypothetical protein CR162_21290 [Pseudoroseomonas rhizosphaerae]|uniref:GAF domain-containing protein n=1 Tax=Teichococcus rhizosphaerae TaxID=1335062 RepID=A0A2C7A7D0_9PROT|nr:hypothetical protein [Pseudoroseomonas rhizosphaerae]PHK92934.1 hypothetical protein CR162_21290 [Pseudoroseomonas rhizosphaerae]